MKRGVCIIECLGVEDPGSEGTLLKKVFNLMEVESELVRVTSIEQLLAAIAHSKFQHIHISTHGSVSNDRRFQGWWTPRGSGTKRAVERQKIVVACNSIVSTACKSGARGFAKYVTDNWGCKYYVAPRGSPYFYDAALFSHIFYYKLFKTKGTVPKAWASYTKRYMNPHGFALYKRNAT